MSLLIESLLNAAVSINSSANERGFKSQQYLSQITAEFLIRKSLGFPGFDDSGSADSDPASQPQHERAYLGYMLHPHLIRGGQTGIRIVRYVT